jgi:F-type H+-transporting ATPase subunit b
MLIDWFTVGAQFINFIVLVLLMKRFLYRPILEAMAARELRIATTLEDAARKDADAEKGLTLLRQREEALEAHRTVLLKTATDDADQRRKQLIAAAREEVSSLQTRWHEAFAKEKDQLRHDLTLRVQAEVLAIARSVLKELASTSLEEAIARQFIRQLRSLSDQERKDIVAVLKNSDHAASVRSVFPMPAPLRLEIEHAIGEQLWSSASVRFETTPDVLGGVELLTAGHKVSWSIEAYLTSLEKSLDEFLDKASQAHAYD